MEYFVDEMPRDCASCKHYHMNCADGYSCSKLRKEIHPNFSEGMGYRHQDCPLQSLSDHDNQVRKEVVEDIKERLKKANLEIMSPIDLYSYTDNFLYQVEKEIKGE